MYVLKRIVDAFVFSNIYVAIPITCLSFQTLWLFDALSVPWGWWCFIYSATLLVYATHRLLGLRQPRTVSIVPRHAWAVRNRGMLLAVTLVAALGCLLSLFLLPYHLFVALLPAAAIAVGYSFPVLRYRGKRVRLRDIPGIKIVLIAMVVSYVTAIIPLYLHGSWAAALSKGGLCAGLERLCFIFAITVPFDIRDLEHDREYGLLTLPLWLGVPKAKGLALVAVLGSMGFSIALQVQGVYSLTMLLAMLLAGAVAGMVILRSSPGRSEYFYSLLVEGMMILQTALLVLAGRW